VWKRYLCMYIYTYCVFVGVRFHNLLQIYS
jgi:hypothetical protein